MIKYDDYTTFRPIIIDIYPTIEEIRIKRNLEFIDSNLETESCKVKDTICSVEPLISNIDSSFGLYYFRNESDLILFKLRYNL